MTPWSALEESRRKIHLLVSLAVVSLGFVVMMFGVVIMNPTAIIWGSLVGIGGLVLRNICYDRLAAVMANRPAGGGKGLTAWTWHCCDAHKFTCGCGLPLFFDGAPFSSNDVDPGGGRYSVVCSCGRGHYKYRTAPRQHTSANTLEQ